MGVDRIFIHDCNAGYVSNCWNVRILLRNLLDIPMKKLIELFKAYELRHGHCDYEGFNKLILFSDGSGKMIDPEEKLLIRFDNIDELEQKLKE